MTATAEKARYFLEQSVPELKEYERKKIFGPEEITSIAKRRSDFEHKINARGSSPSDYAQYAEFEINVEALRKKRVNRLGVKSTAHNGQRRIYFVFDRGTRKFPGDIGLWMQNIEYARQQKAYKKLMQIFTNVLRLHPANSDLWIYAAQFAVDENGDMTEARSYMQRGLRFCKNNRRIWLEYARLELSYMAKIHARRQILAIGDSSDNERKTSDQVEDDNMLRLPKITMADIAPDIEQPHKVNQHALVNLDNTPVMGGAIPQAIFDAAMTQFLYDGTLAQTFFSTFAEYHRLAAVSRILDHVVHVLQENAPTVWQTTGCYVSRPLVGMTHDQPDFPAALRETIKRAREFFSKGCTRELKSWYNNWLRSWVDDDMDPALQRVIMAHLQALESGRLKS